MSLPRLIGCIVEYLREPRAVEHSLKVYAYAHGIGGEEGLGAEDLAILDVAALLHDIGIPAARDRHGSAAGPHQEAEGARLTPEFMRNAGHPDAMTDRVAWLVGHHHTEPAAASDPVLQILMEADYLVNLAEGNLPGREPREVRDVFFRTATGRRYIDALFRL